MVFELCFPSSFVSGKFGTVLIKRAVLPVFSVLPFYHSICQLQIQNTAVEICMFSFFSIYLAVILQRVSLFKHLRWCRGRTPRLQGRRSRQRHLEIESQNIKQEVFLLGRNVGVITVLCYAVKHRQNLKKCILF